MFKRVFSLVLAAAFGVGCGLVVRKYTQPKPLPVEAAPSPAVFASAAASQQKPASSVLPVEEVYPTGYVLRGTMLNVFMSDGTVRTERDSELSRVERNSITLGGKKMFFKASPKSADVSSGQHKRGQVEAEEQLNARSRLVSSALLPRIDGATPSALGSP